MKYFVQVWIRKIIWKSNVKIWQIEVKKLFGLITSLIIFSKSEGSVNDCIIINSFQRLESSEQFPQIKCIQREYDHGNMTTATNISIFISTLIIIQKKFKKHSLKVYRMYIVYLKTYLKLEQGWIIQCPAAFCRTLSWMSAFFEPKSFIANLLSVGWNIFCNWFLTHPGLLESSMFIRPSSCKCWDDILKNTIDFRKSLNHFELYYLEYPWPIQRLAMITSFLANIDICTKVYITYTYHEMMSFQLLLSP